jgi:hypothetical protein
MIIRTTSRYEIDTDTGTVVTPSGQLVGTIYGEAVVWFQYPTATNQVWGIRLKNTKGEDGFVSVSLAARDEYEMLRGRGLIKATP